MLAQPADQHWFISLNGKRYGPYTHAALTEAASRGVINSETLVWRLGGSIGIRRSRYPELIDSPEEEAADLDEAEAEIFEGEGEHDKDPEHVSAQVVASDAPIDHELGKAAYEDGLPIGDDSEGHPLLTAEELAAEDVEVETSPAEELTAEELTAEELTAEELELTAEEFAQKEELDADRDEADRYVAGPQLRERHEPGIITEEQEDAEAGIAPPAAEKKMFPRTAARGLSKELAFAPAAVRESTFEKKRTVPFIMRQWTSTHSKEQRLPVRTAAKALSKTRRSLPLKMRSTRKRTTRDMRLRQRRQRSPGDVLTTMRPRLGGGPQMAAGEPRW